MRMRQVVGGVWGVLIQEVGVGKWAFLAISGLGELEKLKHCHNRRHRRQNLTNLTTAAQHKALAFAKRARTAPPQPNFAPAPTVRAPRASVVQPQLLPAGERHVVRTEDA